MSLLSERPTAVAAGSRASWWRRRRASIAVGVAAVAAVAVVVWSGGGAPAYEAPLDPANPGPDGAQALARVLAEQGVDLEVVRSADDLDDAGVDPATTIVVTEADQLGASTVDRLGALAAGGTVIVDPGPALLDELGLDGEASGTEVDGPAGDPIAGECLDPRFDDLAIEVDQARTVPATGGPTCFGGALSLGAESGSGGLGRPGDLSLLGASDVLSNGQVLRGENAAVALRLLGSRTRLVWYVADAADLSAEDGVGLTSLLPDAVVPALAVLGLALVGLVLWRARRLGPLATEPLPVAVKAIETTRSRGRLYRRAGDHRHAAAVLRTAARDRARARLRLGAADEPTLLRSVAHHTGRPEADVASLLATTAPPPTSDRDLVALATDLTRLDDEVRR